MIYPGTCRDLTPAQAAAKARESGRSPALRIRVPDRETAFTDGHMGRYEENLARDCGDFLLRRSDGMFAYQLAVVVDDAAMGVTEVVRGADLLDSTPRQLLLYTLLGWEAPSFYHLPLLLAPDGRRLSKRNADAGLEVLRGRGPGGRGTGKAGLAARRVHILPVGTLYRGGAGRGVRLGKRCPGRTSGCRRDCSELPGETET